MIQPPTIEYFVRLHIICAMRYTDGNKTKAAKILGISIRSLHDRLKRYDLEHLISRRRKAK